LRPKNDLILFSLENGREQGRNKSKNNIFFFSSKTKENR